ncbi:LemA protein [Saccharomonospora amisosensis]|uniref:LemA protein n=1 Tax=Saccharomonospora amisosensis TaxID=1128677 RepID=A0A7X5UR06_9PSEU|nr:LemA family protein [Saccharomonospora amisosensis]NIJ12178.1 LemA protein [Saccharomonospora amisosensis]
MGTAAIVGLVVAAVVVLLLVIWAISSYNGLVRRRNAYQNAFAQIDVQLTRRHDLIPNLVETAKGYLRHERQTLESVVAARGGAVAAQQEARGKPGDPAAMQQLSGAETALSQTLGRLFALAESYPDLKANQNMMQLSEELTSTENRVAFARQAFNDSVMAYNNKRETFPTNLLAGMFGFGPAALLVIDEPEQREAPRISF